MAFSPMGNTLPGGTGNGDLLDLTFVVPRSVPPGSYTTVSVSQDPASDPPLNDGAIAMAATPGAVNVVPEPSSLALLLAAVSAAGLALVRARRRR